MSNIDRLIDDMISELRKVIEETDLKLHLLAMDIKDEWHQDWQHLKKRFADIELKLESQAEALADKEAAFFIGTRQEVESLVEDIREHKAKKPDVKDD